VIIVCPMPRKANRTQSPAVRRVGGEASDGQVSVLVTSYLFDALA
jgi:hypothetical protein